MSGSLEIVLSDKMQETLDTKKINKAQKHCMLYMSKCVISCYSSWFCLKENKIKISTKQDLGLQCWEMCYFPKFFLNLYHCQNGICMWFISMSSSVRICQFLRQICSFSSFPIYKVILARSAQGHFEDKCSTGTAGFSQEKAWKQCIKQIRIIIIKNILL